MQWFRDGLKAIGASYEIDPLSLESDPAMDVIFVPALTGLGAPYWKPEARGTIFGLTRATSVADLARATLEGVAFQVADLIEAMNHDLGSPLSEVRADGGMAPLRPLPPVPGGPAGPADPSQPADRIDGARRRALLAGLGAGLWPDVHAAVELIESGGKAFAPSRGDDWRTQVQEGWRRAVETVIRHYQ